MLQCECNMLNSINCSSDTHHGPYKEPGTTLFFNDYCLMWLSQVEQELNSVEEESPKHVGKVEENLSSA